MGAIAGLFHPATPKPVDPARLRAMVATMAHRGPDGAGEWTAPGVGFAHRRLATVGGATATQPVATRDLRYAAMLDGTILNHDALRSELLALGHDFAGGGDAEVVLHGFAAWGPALLDRLEGAFAIVVHDAATQTLFLARDRLGAKPLHYTVLPDGALAFASELKGLLAHPLLRRVPDAEAIDDFLALGFVPDDTCVMAGVRKLPAAHFLLVERGRAARAPRCWWEVRHAAPTATEALLPEVRAAVARTAAGVAPEALLLGEVADAAVVALLAEASAKAVRTVAVDDAAAVVAARFATAHRVAAVGDGAASLSALVAAFDEPFAAPGVAAALAAAHEARRSGAIAMAGTGASLVLGGPHWRGFARRERVRRAAWLPRGAAAWLGDVAADHGAAIGMLPAAIRYELWSAEGRRALGDHRPEARFAKWMATGDAMDGAMRADLAIRLPAQALTIADRAGMAAGVEWRAPFTDHRLVAFAQHLPQAVRCGKTSPLSAAMARHLPPLPAGAPVPVPAWLHGQLGEEAARSRWLAETGWFDRDRIARLAAAHRVGQGEHEVLLWRLLVLERSLSRLVG